MEVKDTYVADTRPYSGPLREAARDADRFGAANEKAALAARSMGLAAKEAADKAARAQKDAADAAEKLARGELSVDEAARAAARAENELERASIRAAAAQRATADAANAAARQYRQQARDAELAATAQMLATLKAKGSVDQYNNVLRQAEKIHGDLSKTALSSFQAMEKEGSSLAQTLDSATASLGELGPMWIVPIANGLAMLPSLASVAGDGITLGLGGAIAAVGLKFAAENKQIRAEYKSLGHDVWQTLSEDSAPFVKTLDDINKQARASFAGWEPVIGSVWADMAPAVSHFTTSAIRSLDELKPAVESISHGFDVQLEALSAKLPSDMHNVATGITAIGDAAARNPQALSSLVNDLSLIVRYTGDGIGALVRYKDEFAGFMNVFAGGGPMGLFHFIDGINKLGQDVGAAGRQILGTNHNLEIGGGSFASFAQQASGADVQTSALGQDMDKLTSATASAADKANALTDAFARLLDPEKAVFDDSAKLRDRMAELTASLKKSHGALNDNSAAARTAKESFGKMLTQAEQLSTDMINAHRNISDVRAALTPYINSMYKAAGANQQARQLVDAFVRSLGLVPPTKGTTLKTNAAAAKAQVDAYQRSIDALHGKTVYINTVQQLIDRTSGPGRHAAMGGPIHRADGGPAGWVSGPGTSTSDSIPALLSDGEYVIRASQAAKYGPLLEAINAGTDGFRRGGHPKKKGGTTAVVGGSTFDDTPTYGWKTPRALILADRRVARAKARPEYAAAMAAQASLARMRANVYGGWFGGGPSTIGSAHGSVVQHVTNVTVNVQGSVVAQRQLGEIIRQQLAQRSVYNSGNNGTTVPRGV